MTGSRAKPKFQPIAARLTYREPEVLTTASVRELRKVHRRATELFTPPSRVEQVGWASLGIAASAFISFVVWIPTHLGLPSDQQPGSLVVGIALLLLTGFTLALWGVAIHVSDEVRQKTLTEARHLIEDIEDLLPPSDPERDIGA